MLEKSFLFSRDELAMLLSKFGVESFYGFDLSGFDESPQKYIIFMNRLVRNGIMNIGQDALVFGSEISNVFSCIANCSYIMVFYSGFSYESVKCCYVCGNRIVVTCMASGISDKIKLSLMDIEDFYDSLNLDLTVDLSDEWIDEDEPELGYEVQKVIDFAVKSFSKDNAVLLRTFDHVEWVADVADRNSGEVKQRYFIVSGTECSYIVTIDKNSVNVDLFTKNRAKQCLHNLLR